MGTASRIIITLLVGGAIIGIIVALVIHFDDEESQDSDDAADDSRPLAQHIARQSGVQYIVFEFSGPFPDGVDVQVDWLQLTTDDNRTITADNLTVSGVTYAGEVHILAESRQNQSFSWKWDPETITNLTRITVTIDMLAEYTIIEAKLKSNFYGVPYIISGPQNPKIFMGKTSKVGDGGIKTDILFQAKS